MTALPPSPPPADARSRVLAATVECAGRVGLARTTVELAARTAGVSRASVYRWFPGGREQLVQEAVTFEVGRFFARLAEVVADAPDLASRLERALIFAHRGIEEHEVLQKVLATEPGGVLPQLQAVTPLVLAVIRDDLKAHLTPASLRPGLDPEQAADYLARMFLSFVGSGGHWDLTDPEQVADLVRSQFLAGILASP